MKIKIVNYKVSLKALKDDLKELLIKSFKCEKDSIKELYVIKESVDARHKKNIYISYNLILEIEEKDFFFFKNDTNVSIYKELNINMKYPKWNNKKRPVVVGFGPAGIFASLYLTRCNAKPIIIERGSDIDNRVLDVEEFVNNKNININSNIQFGEGGAGTFSDGKLTTNVKDELLTFIIKEFVKYGAPKEIIYESKPHIGTDYLRKVIKNMREDMKSKGATFYFNTTFEDFSEFDEGLNIKTSNKDLKINTNHLIIGLGHSARDTIRMLYSKNISMEAKAFSMGVRIEHKREDINKSQFGKAYKILPVASYKVVSHLKTRNVYSFCMCPGGMVMASASEDKTIVTNGMSYYKRDLDNSNSALLVGVSPSDFVKTSCLDGLSYQEYYEKCAFNISKDYRAPVNLVKEFLNDEVATKIRSVKPSYPMGYVFADLSKCLPDYVVSSLKEAIVNFGKKIEAFKNPDAVLTGIETRSSCPVRIIRNEFRVSSNKYIYPIGEGAGYAGGISSASLDGLKTAMFIVNNMDK